MNRVVMRYFLPGRKAPIFFMLAALLLIVAACGELDDHEETAADPTATPEAIADEPESDDATRPDEDPRDVLVRLFDATEAEDYQTIYDHLVSDFHIIPYDPDTDERQQWVHLVAPRTFPMLSDMLQHQVDDPANWQIEEHERFSIVRHREWQAHAFVFREENGEWRLYPGESSLVRAWEMSLPEHERGAEGYMGIPAHYQMESEVQGEGGLPLAGIFTYLLYTFTVHDGYADATFVWEVRALPGEPIGDFDEYLYHDILIELDELTWNLDGETGPVEIVWTNAILEDEHLRMPALPEQMVDEILERGPGAQFGQFEGTLRLLDLPDDVNESDEVVLETGNVQIGPMGDGAPAGVDEPLQIRYEHYIPMTSSTRILTGDIPERRDDDSVVEVSPVPPDEVPPGPDPAGLMSILDVEYQREGDHILAVISLDTGEFNPDWGRGFEIIWSDGESTTFAPESWAMQPVVEVEVERESAPDDVEVEALHFDYIIFDLEPDPEATVYEDRIETMWGNFPLGNIVETTDGSGFISYAAAGRRIIHSGSLDYNGQSIRFNTTTYGMGEDLIPEGARLQFQAGFVDAREELPRPAEVHVREIAEDVVIPTHP